MLVELLTAVAVTPPRSIEQGTPVVQGANLAITGTVRGKRRDRLAITVVPRRCPSSYKSARRSKFLLASGPLRKTREKVAGLVSFDIIRPRGLVCFVLESPTQSVRVRSSKKYDRGALPS